jgi:putative Mg2+ transporter-C (MgtC) family protein
MEWSIPQLQIIGEIALAMMLGGVIGFERETANRPAGFRTHMLVAGAAALLVGMGDIFLDAFANTGLDLITSDPLRIVEAIIAGVSFLGAGTIFQAGRENRVQGLTTAASILLVSGIGISVALHQFILAIGVTGLTLAVLIVPRVFSRFFR